MSKFASAERAQGLLVGVKLPTAPSNETVNRIGCVHRKMSYRAHRDDLPLVLAKARAQSEEIERLRARVAELEARECPQCSVWRGRVRE